MPPAVAPIYMHVVVLDVPPGGFGHRLSEMVTWCHEHVGIDGYQTTPQMRGMASQIEFGFKDPERAAAFRSKFSVHR
jgi:hypothetical protein